MDDMGWADVGFNGGTHVSTPRLDQMAREGLVLTDFYVAHEDDEGRGATDSASSKNVLYPALMSAVSLSSCVDIVSGSTIIIRQGSAHVCFVMEASPCAAVICETFEMRQCNRHIIG